jgi:hypothetical protein
MGELCSSDKFSRAGFYKLFTNYLERFLPGAVYDSNHQTKR